LLFRPPTPLGPGYEVFANTMERNMETTPVARPDDQRRVDNPQPQALIDKLARIGWGDWIPTPGVSDEDREFYVSLNSETHLHIMSVQEALSATSEVVEQHLLYVLLHRDEAIARYEQHKAMNRAGQRGKTQT